MVAIAVAVAYRKWSFTRGSNCKALTGKILLFWIGGRLREVVAHGGSTVLKHFTMENRYRSLKRMISFNNVLFYKVSSFLYMEP